ncbi:Hypothetical_protein [Hexamita inflata]|uniref:Hypothetical_protein n=1 Tax=Hexamita inflata TaxID=28002 RepID=A0AA86UG13_9EUKA|nr:Hypothetical protein HINF_LOCUS26808 [Hexamita inflata]
MRMQTCSYHVSYNILFTIIYHFGTSQSERFLSANKCGFSAMYLILEYICYFVFDIRILRSFSRSQDPSEDVELDVNSVQHPVAFNKVNYSLGRYNRLQKYINISADC